MVKPELRAPTHAGRAVVALLFLLAGASIASAQCPYDVCVDTDDYVIRYDGNHVVGNVQGTLVGTYMYYFQTGVSGALDQGDTELANSGGNIWSDFGGTAQYTFPTTTLPTTGAGAGPWTYTATGYHVTYCPWYYCGVDTYSPPYTDGWNGYDEGSLQVQRPTISGLYNGNSFWNLGPGTADPQPTIGGVFYYQSVPLTFNSNCVPSSACSDTPNWYLTTNNQTQLTSSTGWNTTITKGSNQGDCGYDSTLSADIDGFKSGTYSVLVNSPQTLTNIGYGTPAESTVPLNGGYRTSWSLGIGDACATSFLMPIPVHEDFPSGFNNLNGGSNYVDPPGSSFPYWLYTGWATEYTFFDNIGQGLASQNPPVTYTVANAPYTYNTVYLNGTHTFTAGSTTDFDGWLVYTGTIEYYRDHGDNNP